MFIIRTIVFVIHLVVLALLLGTMLNAYIPPQWLGIINLLSLSFPILLIFHFLLTLYWLIGFRKRIILFLLSWTFLLTPIQRWVNYSTPKKKQVDLKVLSYNIRGISKEKEVFLNVQSADVLMLQESGWGETKKMNLPSYKYRANSEIVNIFSNFPIVKHQKIRLSENGYALFADIKVKGEIIRFVNIYLEPFQLDKTMVKPSMNAEINKVKAKSLLSRLLPVFKIHQDQIEDIRKYIKDSPYPVVLAGDFNAVPNSYEYFQFSGLLKDAFLEAGTGSGTTFHDYKFPIRIDYIFASPSLLPLSYKINRKVSLSDHYPIIAEFSISK